MNFQSTFSVINIDFTSVFMRQQLKLSKFINLINTSLRQSNIKTYVITLIATFDLPNNFIWLLALELILPPHKKNKLFITTCLDLTGVQPGIF